MAQNDLVIADQPGATFLPDLNAVLEALVTNNSGATAPTVTYPNMWWFDTSTGDLKQRNNADSAWVLVARKDGSGWRPYFQEVLLAVPSQAEAEAGTATTARLMTAQRIAQAIAKLAPARLPRSYLAGLGTVWIGAAQVRVAQGECRDFAHSEDMVLATPLTKNIAATWAVGDNNGGMEAGGSLLGNRTYHYHLIKRTDTGVVDALYADSVTSPNLPVNYTKFRRIWSMRTDNAGNIRPYLQDGDHCLYRDPPLDANDLQISTAGTNIPLIVPTGIRVLANINSVNGGANRDIIINSKDQNNEVPSRTAAPLFNASSGGLANLPNNMWVRTDLLGEVRARASGASDSTLNVSTQSWIDRRGRDD